MDLSILESFWTQLIIAAGGGAAAAYGLFTYLGKRWLDNRFTTQLQNLKAEQDQTLRYIQSTIDREIHRAKKLHDREFEALTECWKLLRRAVDLSISTGFLNITLLDRLNLPEFEEFLAQSSLSEFEKDELRKVPSTNRTAIYHKWKALHLLSKCEQARVEFRNMFETHSIFIQAEFKKRFVAADHELIDVNLEFEGRILDDFAPKTGNHAKHRQLRDDDLRNRSALEELIRQRLWSATNTGR